MQYTIMPSVKAIKKAQGGNVDIIVGPSAGEAARRLSRCLPAGRVPSSTC